MQGYELLPLSEWKKMRGSAQGQPLPQEQVGEYELRPLSEWKKAKETQVTAQISGGAQAYPKQREPQTYGGFEKAKDIAWDTVKPYIDRLVGVAEFGTRVPRQIAGFVGGTGKEVIEQAKGTMPDVAKKRGEEFGAKIAGEPKTRGGQIADIFAGRMFEQADPAIVNVSENISKLPQFKAMGIPKEVVETGLKVAMVAHMFGSGFKGKGRYSKRELARIQREILRSDEPVKTAEGLFGDAIKEVERRVAPKKAVPKPTDAELKTKLE